MTSSDQKEMESPQSPCIGICQMAASGYCKGCKRSSGEIARWFYADDDEKREILKACSDRRP